MTKKELIKALENYDDDMPVIMFSDPVDQYRDVYLSGTYYNKRENIKAIVLDIWSQVNRLKALGQVK